MGSRCVKLGVIALTLSYWSLEVQHGISWQRTLWGSEKKNFEKKRLPWPWNWAARPYGGLTWQVPFRTGLAMVNLRSWVHVLSIISRGCVWEIDIWVLPALLQRLKGWGSACQSSDHTPHTASNWSAWLSSQKEASSKDDAEESPQTLDYWNHVLWSDETEINLFGSDGVKRVWW